MGNPSYCLLGEWLPDAAANFLTKTTIMRQKG